MSVWLFVHYIAFVMWIGGGLAAMIAGLGMKRMDRSLWGAVVDTQASIYRILIGPGALITLLSGIVMTMEMYNSLSSGAATPWLGVMQGAGLLGAGVMLFGAMPVATRLSRLEPLGPEAPLFDALRKRVAILASIGGTLALIALLAGALYRHP